MMELLNVNLFCKVEERLWYIALENLSENEDEQAEEDDDGASKAIK